jgi:hypothetical protein
MIQDFGLRSLTGKSGLVPRRVHAGILWTSGTETGVATSTLVFPCEYHSPKASCSASIHSFAIDAMYIAAVDNVVK